MVKKNRCFICVAISLALMVCLAGCGEEKDEMLPQYEGWETYSYQHFVYHYHPTEFWGRNIDRFSNFNERYLIEDCEFLAIDVPTDTIHYYIYIDSATGAKETGYDIPYVTSNQIHWGRQVPFGVPIIAYLVPKMDLRPTDYDVLYDGLVNLRDYSGNDYHHKTAMLHNTGNYIPFDTMFNNEAYKRTYVVHRRQEAASLVAYITYNYGINRFKMFWQSTADYKKSIQELFRTDYEQFEEEWKEFVMERFQGMTIEKDTLIGDSVIRKIEEIK